MSADLQHPSFPAPPPGPAAPVDTRPTSVAAIIGLVGAFTCWPVGLVASIIGLVQTRGGAKKGRGIALAGVIINGAAAVVTVIIIALGVQNFTNPMTSPQLTEAGQELQSARNTDDSAAAASEPSEPVASEGATSAASDPFDDVVIDSCESDDTGALTGTATVTNHTGQTASYTLVMGFDDLEGNVVARASGHASAVAPGGSAQVDLAGAGTDLPEDMQCYMDDVVRLPS